MENKKVKKKIPQPYLSVVIPAYNEEKNILSTLKRVESFLNDYKKSYEVLVMDDGSADSTYEISSNFVKTNKKLKVYNLPHKGKANAVISGIKAAKGKYILFADADLATPIEEVKKLLHYITDKKFDISIGSREGVGAVRKDEPFYRHFMGRVFNFIVQAILIKGIEDTQCGFKLFTNESAKKIIKKMKLYSDAPEIDVPKVTAFDTEILFVAKKLGYKVKSVPVEWQYVDTDRVSAWRDSIHNFLDVVKVWSNDKKGLYD